MTAITKSVDLDRRGRVAVLTVNNPPVHALTQHVRQGLYEALKAGLVDEIVDGDLTAAGVAFAEKALSEKRPLKKIRDLDDTLAAVRGKPEVFANFRTSVARQTRGFRAPENIVKAVEAAVSLPFEAGLTRARELFVELLNSPDSQPQSSL